MKPKQNPPTLLPLAFTTVLFLSAAAAYSAEPAPVSEEEPVVLSPFVVDASRDIGYQATDTLSGSRLRTDLKDIGASISVITAEMLEDLAATDNRSLLAFVTNAEVSGPTGNFSGGLTVDATLGSTNEAAQFENPNGSTRIRGLSAADSTRNYFATDIAWDVYNTRRIDLQRGPNAILAGLGSPAGLINVNADSAIFRNQGTLHTKYDKFGSVRGSLNLNRVLIEDQLAVRLALLRDDRNYRQKPAFQDSERAYLATTYRPEFLNRNRVRFELSGSFEYGKIDSNQPRTSPPIDQITPFWKPVAEGGLDRRTFNHITEFTLANNTVANGGLAALARTNISQNIIYYPNSAGNIVANWPGKTNTGSRFLVETIPASRGALNNAGQVQGYPLPNGSNPANNNNFDGTNRAFFSIGSMNTIAVRAGIPYAAFYLPTTLSDPSIFDFYNSLIDGPNKGETTDWTQFDLELTNTFFDDRLGYNIAYYSQERELERYAAMGWSNRIQIDINSFIVMPGANGAMVANPNVGRAYISEPMGNFGSNHVETERESYRLQVFGEHDFGKNNEGLLGRLLGRHRVTGLLSHEGRKNWKYDMKNYAADPSFSLLYTTNGNIQGNAVTPAFKYYLSGDLRGLHSASRANLSNISGNIFFPGANAPVTAFIPTWTAGTTVNPADPYTPVVDAAAVRQGSNPANYQAWTTMDVPIYTIFSPDQMVPGTNMTAREYLITRSGVQTIDDRIDSKVLVWQGYLWKDAIVGLYGWREDENRKYQYDQQNFAADTLRSDGGGSINPQVFNFNNPNGTINGRPSLENAPNAVGQTRNWSVAVHTNRLLGNRDFLPVNVSLYYNQGENTQPVAGRRDAFGATIPNPDGSTKEYSVLLSTKDGKYSLRGTKYETTVINAGAQGTGVQSQFFAWQQIFDANRNNSSANIYRRIRVDATPNLNAADHPDFSTDEFNAILDDWLRFQNDLVARFPDFVNAWALGEKTALQPMGTGFFMGAASLTQDTTSKGYEFEFTANPTPGLRLALNAAKTEAVRSNVPGDAFTEVFDWVDEQILTTPMGLMPMYAYAGPFGLRPGGFSPYPGFRNNYLKDKALNGLSAAEIRKWRFNAIANYSFRESFLKGFGIGGAVRWEDEATIDYATTNVGGPDRYDITAPFFAPAETTVDLWCSYERRVSDSVRWKIQLNVVNAFGKNEVVPIHAQPDGTFAQFRIKEGSTWSISNTFHF